MIKLYVYTYIYNRMGTHDLYQNINCQEQNRDQQELYEYDNDRNSTIARIKNLFGSTLSQEAAENITKCT